MKQIRWLSACVALLISAASDSRAGEPTKEFLDALRARNFYDVALDYLEQMGTNPLIPADVKESILYEKGVTLLESSRIQPDKTQREKQIEESQRLFDDFVAQHRGHPLASTARIQLGTLIVERARLRLDLSKRENNGNLRIEAKRVYEDAYRAFNKLHADLKTELQRIPKLLDEQDPQSRKLAESRNLLRSDYLQSRWMAAAIREEMADTVDLNGREYRELLTDAAQQFGEIYETHRTRLPGVQARLYQGRCTQKLKRYPEALGFLTEVLDQPAETDLFRTFIVKALRYSMECWLDPSQKNYVEAIRRGEDWISRARGTEERHPDWLLVRLLLVRAHMLRADQAKEAKPNDKVVDQSLAAARKHASFVARINGEHQKEAQTYLAQLGGADRSGKKIELKTFEEAKSLGQETVGALQAASLLVKELPSQIGRENDAEKKGELTRRLYEAEKTLATSVDEALGYCRRALSLANEETDLADIHYVRYLLCYLHFTKKNYYDAAMLGEFIATRDPDRIAGRQSAKLALAAYLQLYTENTTADKTFETDHVVSIAEYIATKWPDQPEAEEALSTLVPFMINRGEMSRAIDFISKIPESSTKRGVSELMVGQSLWSSYLKGVSDLLSWKKKGVPPPGTDLPARQAELARQTELEGMKATAIDLLSRGFVRVQQKGSADKTIAVALLSLAQVHVESQQPQKAIDILEHPLLGPLKLVDERHPAAQDVSFVEETYKTALRAYIGALPTASDRDAIQAKAHDTMNKMKEAIAQQKDGQQRLIAVFISLARSIEVQLQGAQPDVKEVLSESFESFLKHIRSDSKDIHVLNWIAETFNGLGGGFDTDGTLTAEAKHYYEESAHTFAEILADSQLESQMKTQLQARQALVYRRLRDFAQAIETYRVVLSANNVLVNVQVEAARTYQEWAAVDSTYYARAIGGSFPDKSGKNTIWGWGRISQVAARYPNLRDTFHEASIHLALCRVLYAEKKQGPDKEKLLQSAYNGIVVVHRLFPDLGGDKWKPQYNSALVMIQKAQGVAPEGLKALTTSQLTGEPLG